MQISQPDENGARANEPDVREASDVAQILEGFSTLARHVTQNQHRTYRAEDRQEYEDSAGGAHKEDVKSGILDDGFYYGRYPDGGWATPKQADHNDNKHPHICHRCQNRQLGSAEWTASPTEE